MTFFNLADHFVDRHIREGRVSKVAIRCGESIRTYGQVAAEVNRVGNTLLSLGLRQGGLQQEQRVLLLLPDCPEFAAAYFGVIKVGGVAVPTSTAARAPDYDYFLRESEARILIVHSTLFNQVAPVLNSQPYLEYVIVVGEPQHGCLHWDELLAESSAELSAAKTSEEDIAFWLWTSGSTGRPKAAVHLHRDWLCCCRNYASGVLGIGPDDITFSSSKLFHAYGLGNGLMFPFHAGATTVLFPGKVQAAAVLEIAQSFRPTLFFSIPTLYALMLQEVEHESFCLDRIRLAVSAAEPLPAEIFRRWHRKFGMEILDGIGSTEALHIYLSARPGHVMPGSTGTAVPGYALRIVDSDGGGVPVGTIGDLLVAGDSIAPCYWNRPELTSERIRDKWFFTGDKYRVDADGNYWYAGRSDDMFRVSGQWVSPTEVESALIEHNCVLEAAVVPHREDGELPTPKAFIVLRRNIAATSELARELQEFVKSRIAPYKYPRRIEFVGQLPKNAAGKVLRYRLRE
jgi:benzoate-CoA ligase family protein